MPTRPDRDARNAADRPPIGRFLLWFVGGLAVVLSLAALADGDTVAMAPGAPTAAAGAQADRTP